MAVEAITTTPTPTEPIVSTGGTENLDYNKMTAAEIMDAYNNKGLAVPKAVFEWAQNTIKTDPNSKITYGESGAVHNQEENDAVSYKESLDEEGISLREQCKIFTELSAEKEVRDLENVKEMAPYAQSILDGAIEGDVGESQVSKLFKEIQNEMRGGYIFSKNFKEDLRFFDAYKAGTVDSIGDISESLEEMQSVLSDAIDDARDSKQHGEVAVDLGKELKGGKGSFFKLFSRKVRIAFRAIEQGNKTIEMSNKTNRMAEAVAKDNNIAIDSLKKNETAIETTNTEGEGGGAPVTGTSASGSSSGGGETA